MTRKSKKYQLPIITLLLCFLQVAGIDVYAQEPVTPVQKDSIIQSREAPKARARRHRDSCSGDGFVEKGFNQNIASGTPASNRQSVCCQNTDSRQS